MEIGSVVQREVVLVQLDECVRAAAERMRERDVSTLVVVTPDERPLGIVTDRDIVLRLVAEGRDARDTHVAEIMTRAPKVVSESASADDALAAMRDGACRRLPVVNGHGCLTGMIVLDDLIRLAPKCDPGVGAVLETQLPAAAADAR